MSFKATITESGKQNIWFRAIYVLSTIQDDIKITVTTNELIAWSMNETDTTLCQVRFQKSFLRSMSLNHMRLYLEKMGFKL